jgi:hypothetical protein
MPSRPRNKDATWRSLSTICRERDWSSRRLLHELRQGTVLYRTVPPDISIDWWDPNAERSLDLATSEVTIVRGAKVSPLLVGLDKVTVGIELLVPSPPPPAGAPAARKRIAAADEEQCFLAIMRERPNDPLGESDLLKEMKSRLGASPVRERIRNLRRTVGAEWRRPRGHPPRKCAV